MSRTQVVELLQQLDADDFSSEMQVVGFQINADGEREAFLPDSETLREWMWSVPGYEAILETRFENETLVAMNYWDGTKPVNRYHHLLEHASVKRITFHPNSTDYEVDVIEVFPER